MSLLILTVLIAVYDFRTGRVLNWITLPLLLTGVLLHYPGAPAIWLGCMLLFLTWRLGWLGGGDVKLWMALLWLAPVNLAQNALVVLGTTLIVTALGQLLMRWLTRRSNLTGVRSPGAWRAIPFAVWLLYVH
jgi:Flp pilus assembly protein protease CpaA